MLFFRFLVVVLLLLRRQDAAKEIEKSFRAHRDQPRRVIAAMRHYPRLAAAIAFGLDAGIGEIKVLDALDLEMQPRKRVADHVWTIRAAGKLLSAPRVVTVFTQQRCKFALTKQYYDLLVQFVLLSSTKISSIWAWVIFLAATKSRRAVSMVCIPIPAPVEIIEGILK